MIQKDKLETYFDRTIRFFLYVLLFWLPYSEAVIESCVGTALVLWIAKRICLKRVALPSSALNIPILVFIVSCSISVVLCASFDQAWHNFLTKTMEWFIIYFLALEVFKTKKQIYWAFGILLGTSLLVWADSLIQYYFTGKDLFDANVLDQGYRATASFDSANGLGSYWALLLPILFVFSFKKKWFISLFVLFLWSFVLTFSRGAWVGAAVGITFALYVLGSFINQSSEVIKKIRLVILILILVGCCAVVFKQVSIPQLNRSSSWRVSIWQYSLEMVSEKPLFGHGINTYMKLFPKYRPKHVGIYDHWPTYAHNCYIQILCETGIFGLLAFLSILYALYSSVLHQLKKEIKEADPALRVCCCGLLSGITAFLVHSFFDTQFYSLKLSSYLWIMLGLLMASINILKRTEKSITNGQN